LSLGKDERSSMLIPRLSACHAAIGHRASR
jgi:hypothetical protein